MGKTSKIRQIGETIHIPEDSSSQAPSGAFFIDGKYYEELNKEVEISEEDIIKHGIVAIRFTKPDSRSKKGSIELKPNTSKEEIEVVAPKRTLRPRRKRITNNKFL